jgi:chromate reductase
MRILGIAGSLRRNSYNRRLLRAAVAELSPGAALEIWEGLSGVPPYSEDADREPIPAGALALRVAIERSDALLISTPEYNGTLPGQLKNAIDWASRPYPDSVLRGRPVAVIGASTGLYGAVWGQADARRALGIAGARVLDQELPVPRAPEQFGSGGELVDAGIRARLEEVLCGLSYLVGARRRVLAA